MCEPATAFVTEGILVEFEGMNWSPTHTPLAEVCKLSWSSTELVLDELDEEEFAGLQSLLVPPSSKLSSSLLVKPVPSHLSLAGNA